MLLWGSFPLPAHGVAFWVASWWDFVVWWAPSGIFQCIPILGIGFAAQTSLFLVYQTMPTHVRPYMGLVTDKALSGCVALYILVWQGERNICDIQFFADLPLRLLTSKQKTTVEFPAPLIFPITLMLGRRLRLRLPYYTRRGNYRQYPKPFSANYDLGHLPIRFLKCCFPP